METATANLAKQNFGELIDRAQKGAVTVTKHGRIQAVRILHERMDFEHQQIGKSFP